MNKIEFDEYLQFQAIIHWNNIVKKLKEEARKLKEQEFERLRLLQETTDFLNECDRRLDYMEKMFFYEYEYDNLILETEKVMNTTQVRVGNKVYTFYWDE